MRDQEAAGLCGHGHEGALVFVLASSLVLALMMPAAFFLAIGFLSATDVLPLACLLLSQMCCLCVYHPLVAGPQPAVDSGYHLCVACLVLVSCHICVPSEANLYDLFLPSCSQ